MPSSTSRKKGRKAPRVSRGYLFACSHGAYEPTRRAFARMLWQRDPIAGARSTIELATERDLLPGPPHVELPGMLWASLTRAQAQVLRDMVEVAAMRVVVGQSSCFLYSRSYCSERTGLSQGQARGAIDALRDLRHVRKSEALSAGTNAYVLSDELLDRVYEELACRPSRKCYTDTSTSGTGAGTGSATETALGTPVRARGTVNRALRASVTSPRACISCGADISHRRSDASTCSTSCRVRIHRARSRRPL